MSTINAASVNRPGSISGGGDWLASVRVRSAIASAAVVAVALGFSGGLLVVLLQRSLEQSATSAAQNRAAEVADQVEQLGVTGLSGEIRGGSKTQIVQVVTMNGQVVVGYPTVSRQEPITRLRPQPGVVQENRARLSLLDADEPFVVIAHGAAYRGTPYIVIVGASTQPQRETISTVVSLLAIGFPLLVLVVAGATFYFVGRSLRPVEQIRARVAGIGARQLSSERVPIPPSRDEVARLALTMNAMLDRLQRAQEAQQRFVADASHELRSPLTTLSAALELVGSEGSWRDLKPVMAEEASRLSRLVEDLLLLAKIDESPKRATEDVDLDDLVDAEVRRMRAAGGLAVDADVVPVRVQGDRDRLGQVLRNLMDNAARHAHGRIAVRLRIDDGDAVIEVDDDGDGIAPADRQRVFDRFVRVDVSRERSSGGSGLGLAIVRDVVVGHGGTVHAKEAALGGARFVVRLPTAAAPAQPPSALSR